MTSDQISNEIVSKDKEILKAQEDLSVAQERQFHLKKDLLDVSEIVRLGKLVISKKRTERQILEREFWSAKNA